MRMAPCTEKIETYFFYTLQIITGKLNAQVWSAYSSRKSAADFDTGSWLNTENVFLAGNYCKWICMDFYIL